MRTAFERAGPDPTGPSLIVVIDRAGKELNCGVKAGLSSAKVAARRAGPGGRPQVPLDTLMVGNLAEKSLALTAILTATWRATAL